MGGIAENGELTVEQCWQLSGPAHLIASSAGKARRIGGSTSYNETLGACRGRELAQLIAMRYGEILSYKVGMTARDLMKMQADVQWPIPIDHCTDCGDLFELATGSKGCPQDKTQRLHVLTLREDRMTRRIRYFIQIPTESMLVDALTKVMLSGLLMTFLTCGYFRIQHADHCVRLRVMRGTLDYTEKDLENMDGTHDITTVACTSFSRARRVLPWLLFAGVSFTVTESAKGDETSLVSFQKRTTALNFPDMF